MHPCAKLLCLFPTPHDAAYVQMMFIFVIYNSIYIPINIAFNIDKPLAQCIIDLMIDVLFISDMLLNLRTTYYDEENELVLDKKAIYRKYLCSTWFGIDVLAVFPFDLVFQAQWTCGIPNATDNQDGSFTTVIKLLKALRLLRLVRFRKELDRLSGAALLRVAVALSIFLLVAHWVACVWWAVGTFGFYEDGGFNTSAVNCDRTKPCSWFRRVPQGQMQLSPNVEFGQQYVSSFYWSLTTLMKTPWIGPDTIFEKIVGFLLLLMSAIVNAYFLSTVQGSYTAYSKQSAAKRDKLTSLRGFMAHHDFPNQLRHKLLAHTFTHHATLPTGLNNVNVLSMLPSHLRNSVTLELYTESCGGPPALFPKVSTECAKSLTARLSTTLLMPDQLLIAKGEVCQNLYFLFRGTLCVTVEPPSKSSTNEQEQPDPTVKRSSSRKSIGAASRIIEKQGSRIGLIEPVNGSGLGVYPVYVAAGTKKVLVLSVSRAALAETLSGFAEDVPALRETLYKEHKAIMDGLKMPEIEGSPLFVAEKSKKQSADDKKITVDDALLDRVRALEGIVQDTMDNMSGIQQNMEALPRILRIVERHVEDPEAMKKLTGGRPTSS